MAVFSMVRWILCLVFCCSSVLQSAAGPAVALPPAALAESSPDESTSKATAARVFEEIFNQGKFDVAGEIYAPGFVNHGLHRDATLQEDQDAVHAEKRAFPDLRMTVDLLTAKDDLLTAVWKFRGTHTGWGMGLPPTGAKIELRGITVWRIVDGRITEEWTSFDEMGSYLGIATQWKWPIVGFLFVLVVALVISNGCFSKSSDDVSNDVNEAGNERAGHTHRA